MAQAPATPKVRRALLRAAAGLLGAGRARALARHASERAALDARARTLSPPEAPRVVFLIPLVGAHHVTDWSTVETRLAATVASLIRQTAPDWTALICGQTRPALPEDPRLRFLPFDRRVEGNDKWEKLATLAAALPLLGHGQGYAMPFDADDLLAPWAVEHMTEGKARGGYLVTRGLVQDRATGEVARTVPKSLARPGQKAFWKLCGSCAAFGFDLRESPRDAALIGAITAHEHRMFPYLARLAGRPLRPLPADAALYMVNHGENFGARRGRTGFKTRFVRRFSLRDPGALAQIAADFPEAGLGAQRPG